METAEGVLNTTSAAVEKFPVSAMATKVLNMSLSSNGSGWRKVTVMARTFKYFDL
jgi:hypothetical protein